MRVIQHSKKMFQKPPMKIIYCYGIHQEAVKELERKYPNLVVTHQGLPNEKFIDDEFENVDHGLIVLDDLIQEIGSSKEMANLFTRDVHHKVNTEFFFFIIGRHIHFFFHLPLKKCK